PLSASCVMLRDPATVLRYANLERTVCFRRHRSGALVAEIVAARLFVSRLFTRDYRGLVRCFAIHIGQPRDFASAAAANRLRVFEGHVVLLSVPLLAK